MRLSRHRVTILKRVLDCDDFAAFVVSALRTNAVRHLGLMALRTGRQRLRFEEVCARRVRVRAFEWRRFGLGIVLLLV